MAFNDIGILVVSLLLGLGGLMVGLLKHRRWDMIERGVESSDGT